MRIGTIDTEVLPTAGTGGSPRIDNATPRPVQAAISPDVGTTTETFKVIRPTTHALKLPVCSTTDCQPLLRHTISS
jgi:hypothetical protein